MQFDNQLIGALKHADKDRALVEAVEKLLLARGFTLSTSMTPTQAEGNMLEAMLIVTTILAAMAPLEIFNVPKSRSTNPRETHSEETETSVWEKT